MNKKQMMEQAREVLKIEAESILNLIPSISDDFVRAVDMIFKTKGRVIVTGIGKSGLIGKKIVATLTSTGTPAIFLHPVEGLHGDLGIVTKDDVILAISNSGETGEINSLICRTKEIGVPLIVFTGNRRSTLAGCGDIVINVGVKKEACPFNLTPTSSTTAALAMGDALAIALIGKRDFQEKDFYRFHPGGTLGQRLQARVRDIMIGGEGIPRVLTGTPFMEAVEELDRKNVGFVIITDNSNHLMGILTDGDMRRYVKRGVHFKEKIVDDLMTRKPKTIDENETVARTVERMQKDEITALVVVDENRILKGYIHLHDILGRGGTIQITISNST
ncbi:MAG: KpsF/GutQ family sugar-phosphate isomerase [Deltaproteobacteria bacterium]|nr:KpsF/GutQ family sugar-phosphate isomerase [Deltaproteobacteria bacterium]